MTPHTRAATLLGLGVAVVTVASTLPAAAVEPAPARPPIQVTDGATDPIHSYEDAIREVVYVESTSDNDGDGVLDRVAMKITRPEATETEGLQVATIVQASPYFGGGWGDTLTWHPDDVVDEVELAPWDPPTGEWAGWTEQHVYVDNYFVPRGYAVVKAATIGSWDSTGCGTNMDADEQAGMVAMIEWLAGRGRAYDEQGEVITADWSTGRVGMTGKSYEGSLPIAAAASGVDGLDAIISIQGVADWYQTVRRNGVLVHSPTFPGDDVDMSVKNSLSRKDPAVCEEVVRGISEAMDRPSGDRNQFWDDRDFLPDVGNFPPTLLVAGLRDESVTMKHFTDQWAALGDHGIPRKAWIIQAGHDDPLYVSEQGWLDQQQAWFDHWLYDVDNGVMDEAPVHRETAPGVWVDEQAWPAADAKRQRLWLGPGDGGSGEQSEPGTLGPKEGRPPARQSFTDDAQQETPAKLGDMTTATDGRLVYLGDELTEAIRVSGTPKINLRASVDGRSPYLTAYLVDLGSAERITGFWRGAEEWCFGPSMPQDSGCRARWAYETAETPYEVISRGHMDVRNRLSEYTTDPVEAGKTYRFRFDLEPTDRVVAEGHRLVLVIFATDYDRTLRYPSGTEVELRTQRSKIVIPAGSAAAG